MKLQIIGSGSCRVHQNERKPSGYILETENQTIMLDTGTGTTTNISESDYAIQEIDIIINTHRHPDHISDLTPIIQEKIVNSFSNNEEEIKLIGPKGHSQYLKDRFQGELAEDKNSIKENFGFEIKILELEPGENLQIGKLLIKAYETDHGPENFQCLSLRIEEGEKSVFFTGDTDYFDELSGYAENTDLIIADCSKPNEEKSEGHMTPEECTKLGKKAKTNHLVLSHLYPEMDGVELENQIPSNNEFQITKAKDLMKIEEIGK